MYCEWVLDEVQLMKLIVFNWKQGLVKTTLRKYKKMMAKEKQKNSGGTYV